MTQVATIEPRDAAPVQPSNVAPFDPMAMIQIALERGQSAEMIDKLISLGERMATINARKAFETALAAAKAEIPIIAKKATGHNNKAYANFAAYAKVIDPILSKYGLSYRFRTTQDERIKVTCILSHKDGHSEENSLAGPADSSGSKNAIQAIGSTLTYLLRYTLIQALGLAASEDDDGRASAGDEPPALVNADQMKRLRDALSFKGRSETDFCRVMKRERLEDLEASRFDGALAWIGKLPAIPEKADA